MRKLETVIFKRAVSHGLCKTLEEAQTKETWTGEEFDLIGMPMLGYLAVSCSSCGMTMSPFSALIGDNDEFLCKDCAE